MQTPTISKKQAQKSLAGKKTKKSEVIKNVLLKPYENYWPALSFEDNKQLVEVLDKYLPRVKPIKICIPFSQIKNIPQTERKKFRESLTPNQVDQVAGKNIVFGVNDVTNLLSNQEAGCVLVDGSVQPRLLVQNLLDQCVLHNVPVLVVEGLKTVFRSKCGISGAAVALKKSLESDSSLGLIRQTILQISENYPVPENHIHWHRKQDISTITIPDSDISGNFSSSDEATAQNENKNYYLERRSSKKRVFVPDASRAEKISAYIDLDPSVSNENGIVYHALKVQRVRGDKNRNTRKMDTFKRKRPVAVLN